MSAQNRIQNVLKRAQQLDISPTFLPYSGVEIVTGKQDEHGNDIVYFSGDASGRVLTITNPWGTQAQADDIIAKIRGFTYQPYIAEGALLDPTAELGDGISVNDVYSGIYKLSRTFSSLMSANIAAPQSEDLDHEYPYESKADRAITRKFSAMESELAINSQEISAKVSVNGGASQSVSWSLTASNWSVYANGTRVFRITPTGAEVNGKITARSGKIGGFDIGASAISYNGLTWNGNKTGVYLGTSGIQLGAANGAFFQASSSGVVKAHNMTLTGTLTIGGQTITAAALRSGAQTAYDRSGTWNGTTTTVNNNSGSWTTGANRAGQAYNVLFNGTATATYIKASHATLSDVTLDGYDAGWKSITVITGVNPTTRSTIYYYGR